MNEPIEKISFKELKARRSEWKSAVIVFKQGPYFNREYTELERSYRLVENDMWGLDDTKSGRRITGSSLDGSDKNVRIDAYIYGSDPNYRWQIDYCYIEQYV